MKKNPEIFFNPQADGSGLLSLSWVDGPFGEGIETEEGFGVGFFDTKGEVLSVQFFDVTAKSDQQTLSFENGFEISIKVKNGKIVDIKKIYSKKVA